MKKDREAHGKVHKILHSRYFWAVFGLVLSFVQVLVVFILLYEFFMPVTILAIMFHVGVLLYVINRDEILEFHDALMESLEQAEQFIFMEYFIVQPGKMYI